MRKLAKIMALIVLFSAILTTTESTYATTTETLQPASFLNNPVFANGLQGWSRNLVENLGTNVITADSTYGNSAKLYVSGAPAAGDIEQQITQPILKGTKLAIRVYQTDTRDFGAWQVMLYNGTFAGIDPDSPHRYTGGDGVMTYIDIHTYNRTEGYKIVYWNADRDYPAGTWFILHGSVWPGTATYWFLGVYTVQEASEIPFWLQWWFWAIAALGIVAIALTFTAAHFRKKTFAKKEAKASATQSSKDYKVCPNCGANLPIDSKFCGKCGASLE